MCSSSTERCFRVFLLTFIDILSTFTIFTFRFFFERERSYGAETLTAGRSRAPAASRGPSACSAPTPAAALKRSRAVLDRDRAAAHLGLVGDRDQLEVVLPGDPGLEVFRHRAVTAEEAER